MITRKLSEDAILIEDAETKVKLIVKEGYFKGKSKYTLMQEVRACAMSTVKKLKSGALAVDTIRSLQNLANREIIRLQRELGFNGVAAAVLIGLALSQKLSLTKVTSGAVSSIVSVSNEPLGKGVPMQEYSKTYMKRVNRVMSQIASDRGLDPNDVSGRNSLRNLAEMQTRFEAHQEEINNFKSKGTKLVVCSVHADCSDRCFPFQGKVFSLDGTSGTTKDGKRFVPLENATDIFYISKSGKVYKNGLLGYNCRHKLYEYMPNMRIPQVSKAIQEKENEINKKQRQYENNIRKFREQALLAEDPVVRKKAKKKASELNKEYVAFSIKNKRAYYPDRVKVLFEKF